MAADTLASGSFDDLPDAELRIVLAVPLALPAPEAAPRPREAPAPPRPRAAAGRHRSRVSRPTRSAAMDTLRVGLSAAAFVVLLVVVGLLAVDRLAR